LFRWRGSGFLDFAASTGGASPSSSATVVSLKVERGRDAASGKNVSCARTAKFKRCKFITALHVECHELSWFGGHFIDSFAENSFTILLGAYLAVPYFSRLLGTSRDWSTSFHKRFKLISTGLTLTVVRGGRRLPPGLMAIPSNVCNLPNLLVENVLCRSN